MVRPLNARRTHDERRLDLPSLLFAQQQDDIFVSNNLTDLKTIYLKDSSSSQIRKIKASRHLYLIGFQHKHQQEDQMSTCYKEL